jgi:hypothetical protein
MAPQHLVNGVTEQSFVRCTVEKIRFVIWEVFENDQLKKWRAQGDDLRTFLYGFVLVLPQLDSPLGLRL